MTIYLIRHGETTGNAGRILQFPDSPLTERGRIQARHLAMRMRALNLHCIVTSDYLRARDTAEAVRLETGVPLHLHPGLRERNFGDHRGQRVPDLTVNVFAPDYTPPNGESLPDFNARVERAWQALERWRTAPDVRVAVVAHSLVCRSIVEHCLGHDLDAGQAADGERNDVSAPDAAVAAEHAPARRPRRPMRFGNTSVTTIDGPPWRVSQLACTAHLPEALVTHLSRRSEQ